MCSLNKTTTDMEKMGPWEQMAIHFYENIILLRKDNELIMSVKWKPFVSELMS